MYREPISIPLEIKKVGISIIYQTIFFVFEKKEEVKHRSADSEKNILKETKLLDKKQSTRFIENGNLM